MSESSYDTVSEDVPESGTNQSYSDERDEKEEEGEGEGEGEGAGVRKRKTKNVLKTDVNFNTYIAQIYADVKGKSERKINSLLKGQLNSMLNHIARAAGQQANAIAEQAGKPTITAEIMLSTVANMFGGKKFDTAAKTYNKSMENEPPSKDNGKVLMASRCGLHIPPSRMIVFLKLGGYEIKNKGANKNVVGRKVGVVPKIILAEFLEYIVRELLSAALSNKDKKMVNLKTISIDHVSKLLNYSKNPGVAEHLSSGDLHFIKKLNDLLCKLKIQITMASANEEDIIKPAIKRDAADAARSKPGKVAGQKVRQMQKMKGNRVVTHMAPLHRTVKSHLRAKNGPQNVSKSAMTVLHLFLEKELVDFLMDANELAKHAGRIGINRTDVELARKHLKNQCVA